MSDVRVLIVDPDTTGAQKLGLALDNAGLPVTWCSFAPTEVAESVRAFAPSVLLVRAEAASPQLGTLLARVEGRPLPVVLLCRDTTEQKWAKALKTGIVELLAEPFSKASLNRLVQVIGELPARPGRITGRGAKELNEALGHLMRTRRTGELQAGEGAAWFDRGVLTGAQLKDLAGQNALSAMARQDTAWTFVEGVAAAPAPTSRSSSRLPAVGAPTSASQQGLPAVGAQPDPDAAKTPILFVDDDEAIVQLVSSYFTRKGYPLVTATDGVDAITQMQTRPFELVIVDLNMPRLDGWGFLRLVREDLRTRETPVAVFSAQDSYRDSLRLSQAGAQAYFPKTMRMSALEVQVKELCEPRRRFTRLIDTDGGIEFEYSKLGPQWVLKALTLAGFQGQVDARDEWAKWILWFERGRLVQCTSRVGTTSLAGDTALNSFLSSRNAEGGLSRGTPAPDEGFAGQSTAQTLARLVPWLNDQLRKAAEGQLAKARALDVNEELYRLFQHVGPPAWQPMVKLLCEDKLTPAQVIAQLNVTPLEVAQVVKELLRRGVASPG